MKVKYEKGNYAQVPNIAEAMNMSESGFKVYIALCKYADESGGCFPSAETIREFTFLSENSVKKGLREVRDWGFVEVTRQKRPNGSNSSNHYQILIVSVLSSRGANFGPPLPPNFGPPLTTPIEHTLPNGKGAEAQPAPKQKDSTDQTLHFGGNELPPLNGPPPVVESTTASLFYKVIKKYSLPVNNHTHIKKWVADLETTHTKEIAQLYLERLLQRDLVAEKDTQEFVPTLSNAFDIYNKSAKIIQYLQRTKGVTEVVVNADDNKKRFDQMQEEAKRIREG